MRETIELTEWDLDGDIQAFAVGHVSHDRGSMSQSIICICLSCHFFFRLTL